MKPPTGDPSRLDYIRVMMEVANEMLLLQVKKHPEWTETLRPIIEKQGEAIFQLNQARNQLGRL